MKVFTPTQSAQILDCIQSIQLSNNGYARFRADDLIVDAVRSAGFVVFKSTDMHGNACWFGSTREAQKALSTEPYGVSTYKPMKHKENEPDYEGAILARQESDGFYD